MNEMNIIFYRAQPIDQDKFGPWVFSESLVQFPSTEAIMFLPVPPEVWKEPDKPEMRSVKVQRSTVCRMTGMKDINGADIFEHDIIYHHLSKRTYKVFYCVDLGGFVRQRIDGNFKPHPLTQEICQCMVVDGTIFDQEPDTEEQQNEE